MDKLTEVVGYLRGPRFRRFVWISFAAFGGRTVAAASEIGGLTVTKKLGTPEDRIFGRTLFLVVRRDPGTLLDIV
jgi:hypothetical protein